MYQFEQDNKFEQAIFFASNVLKKRHNPKPVFLHSLRVAFMLYMNEYNIDVCIAGLLHDALEDTNTDISEIEKQFGQGISDLVLLLTMDFKIEDYKEQYLENFRRCDNYKEALVVRLADILDNSRYIHLANVEMRSKVTEKHLYFYRRYKQILCNESLWQEFEEYINKRR